MTTFKTCIVIVAMIAASFSASAAQLVVVAVEGSASVNPGDVVDDAKIITLNDGVTVTLISATGQKLKINGPYNGPLDGKKAASATGGDAKPGYDVVNSLAGLFKSKSDTKSLGAFRAALARVPGPWMFNVAAGDSYCINPDQKPQLWRESARKKLKVTFSAENGGVPKTVIWRKGKSTLKWPTSVALANGIVYTLKVGRRAKEQPVTARFMPQNLPSPAHQAVWMAENGCVGQARLLVVTATTDLTVQN